MLGVVDDVTFEEEGSTSITLTSSDIDSSDLTYGVSGGTSITASIVDDTITFTVVEDFNGTESFTATVTDGEYTDSHDFQVTVTPINDAPVIGSLADATIDEDGTYQVDLSADDVDNILKGKALDKTNTNLDTTSLSSGSDGSIKKDNIKNPRPNET